MHRRQPLPHIWLVTDERMGDALLQAVTRLPRGSGILFRHYSLPPTARRALFDRLRTIARRRHLVLSLAGPSALAESWGADGAHGPSARANSRLLVSRSVHDLRELRAAERAGADLVFLSSVFPTRSHPGAPSLGPLGFAALAGTTDLPVIALGGMTARRHARLSPLGAYGWAAIDAWMG